MACADVDMDIQEDYDEPFSPGKRTPPPMQDNQATEFITDNLLQKHPAVLGSMQVGSGLVSVGVGILLAATRMYGPRQETLFTVFRVSHLTGVLFIIAGVVSNLLFKYPELLPFSLVINCGCIIVAAIAACLISVDLANWNQLWNPANDLHLKMEVLVLCVLLLEVVLSAIVCFWLFKEKRAKSL